jgi:hypothetical protein
MGQAAEDARVGPGGKMKVTTGAGGKGGGVFLIIHSTDQL